MRGILFALLTSWVLLIAMTARAEPVLAARVNGAGIPEERLERAFEESLRQRRINIGEIRFPERLKQMKREVLDNLVEQELFWQQSQSAGIVVSPEEIEQAYQGTQGQFRSAETFEQRLRTDGLTLESYRELLRRQLSAREYVNRVVAKAPAVTDAEVHRFYLDNPDKFRQPEVVRARHILIKVAEGEGETERAGKHAHMEQILKQARAGADFAELARQHSEAPTKQWGGEMDPIRRGQAAPSLENVVFALAAGQVSDVLSAPGGFEILKVESHSEAMTVGEEQARDTIRKFLQETRAQQSVRNEIERLRAAGKIEILLSL
jgi:parvulin-like peptidyl-prolyl isomerase